jgi:heme exporter protein D
MQWHSAHEFFAMGGYAGYVWGSVGACALAIALESWLLKRRHRRLVEGLRRRGVRNAEPTRQRTVSQREGMA